MVKLVQILFLAFVVAAACKKDTRVNNQQNHPIHIEVLLENLEIPWGMAFLPNGDFIFSQRNGKIELLKSGASSPILLMQRNVSHAGEDGLLGLAVDPDFIQTNYVFLYETTEKENRVVRLILKNETLTENKIILEGIPKAINHDGGALRFGPDGYLYVGTGDAMQAELAQDLNSLAGKILRLDKEGNSAPGNPFNNAIWTYGHRNVQGFDWSANEKMIATEHGPSGEFGWCCHDEINLIERGKNYGWPLAIGGTETDTLIPPINHSGDDTWAPSGCTFIKGKEWGTWENNLIVACLRGQRLIRFTLNSDDTQVINKIDTLQGEFSRIRNIIQAPDGSLLFSTSNGSDDKIYKIFIND